MNRSAEHLLGSLLERKLAERVLGAPNAGRFRGSMREFFGEISPRGEGRGEGER